MFLLCIQKSGHGPHNATWLAAGWRCVIKCKIWQGFVFPVYRRRGHERGQRRIIVRYREICTL